MKRLGKLLLAASVAAALALSVAGPTSAAPAGTGFDDVNDLVTGSGSDTTYTMMAALTKLYNSTPGCDTDNVTGSATHTRCLTGGQQTSTETKANWDHDVFLNLFPTGSSAGVKALQLGTLGVDYARSSRGPKTSGESDLNFFAFAKDGLVFMTFAGRPALNLSKAQIQGIYNCTIVEWDDITGNPADNGKTIRPYGMNPASGTKASMDTFLGFDANAGSCVQKTGTVYPFENDAKPPIADAISKWGTAQDIFWWSSFAEMKTYSYKRQSGVFWSVDGIGISNGTIANNTYPAKRFVYHVTRKVDATPEVAPAFPGEMAGGASGESGAVRQLTEWMCKLTAEHTTNPFYGTNYYADISGIIVAEGYQRVPAAERTHGACKTEPGA